MRIHSPAFRRSFHCGVHRCLLAYSTIIINYYTNFFLVWLVRSKYPDQSGKYKGFSRYKYTHITSVVDP